MLVPAELGDRYIAEIRGDAAEQDPHLPGVGGGGDINFQRQPPFDPLAQQHGRRSRPARGGVDRRVHLSAAYLRATCLDVLLGGDGFDGGRAAERAAPLPVCR
jgi:hypothetical protein